MRRAASIAMAAAALIGVAALIALAARQTWYEQAVEKAAPWALETLAGRIDALGAHQHLEAVSLDLDLTRAPQRIDATAELDFISENAPQPEIVLLLNECFRVQAVRCNGKPVKVRREGPALFIPRANGDNLHVKIEYGGEIPASANRSGVVNALLMASGDAWYPNDGTSFYRLACRARLRADQAMPVNAAMESDRIVNSWRIVAFQAHEAVAGLALAVGDYQAAKPELGFTAMYTLDAAPASAAALRREAARIFDTLRDQLGPLAIPPPLLLGVPGVTAPEPLGFNTIAVPPAYSADGNAQYVALAAAVARAWWSEAVAPARFSAAAEGAAWFDHGLPEYYALEALRLARGRNAYLRHIEDTSATWTPHRVVAAAAPRSGFGVARGDAAHEGASAARALAETVGRETFRAACAGYLHDTQRGKASSATLLERIEREAQRHLAASERAWVESDADADYALADVVASPGQVHLRVENRRTTPVTFPLTLALVLDDTIQFEELPSGAARGAFTFPLPGPVRRVVLDPFLAAPDANRANNVWPPPRWPAEIAAVNETFALALANTWQSGGINSLLVRFPNGRDQSVALPPACRGPLAWDARGEQLLVAGRGVFAWDAAKGVRRVADEAATPLGWIDGDWCAYSAPSNALLHGGTVTRMQPGDRTAPRIDSLRTRPGDESAFWLEKDGTVSALAIRAASELRAERIQPGLLDFAWSSARGAWVGVERQGALVDWKDAESISGAREVLSASLRTWPYALDEARLAPGANNVAWLDPARNLRWSYIAPGAPDEIAVLGGEVIAFSWASADILFALSVETRPLLPMRMYGDYAVWRIDMKDNKAQCLGVLTTDPGNSAVYLRRRE